VTTWGYQLACFETPSPRAPISACADGSGVVSAAIVSRFGLVHHPFSENRIAISPLARTPENARAKVSSPRHQTSAALNEYLRISLSPLNRQSVKFPRRNLNVWAQGVDGVVRRKPTEAVTTEIHNDNSMKTGHCNRRFSV